MIFFDKESDEGNVLGFLEIFHEMECHSYISDIAVNVLIDND